MQIYNIEKQHKKGKLHAIERINMLLDANSFFEINSQISHNSVNFGMDKKNIPYDGVITGFGTIEGQKVGIYAQDFTIMGGTLGKQHGFKITQIIKTCIKAKCPIIGINDSGGARIHEGIDSLAGYGEIFYYNTLASGYVPQISIIAGPCAGGAVYSPGLTDFVFLIDDISKMFVTGPKVVKSVMNEDVTLDQLGGTEIHSSKSGVAHFRAKNEKECFYQVKQLLNIIPHYYGENKDIINSEYKLKRNNNIYNLLPKKSNLSYDIVPIIYSILDDNSFIEIQEYFAKNSIVGFGRISNILVGIVANQPKYLAGVLDCDSSDKISRFVRYCDSFDIPLITFTDVPGFLPGLQQESKGIIRHGAKILYAYSEATVPKINVIIRKAYGGAYIAMCSKHLGADFIFAWPSAEIAVMGAESAVSVLYEKEMKKSINVNEFCQEKIKLYNDYFINPKLAAQRGYIDEIIEPKDTRKILYKTLILLSEKKDIALVKKKHGNIPL